MNYLYEIGEIHLPSSSVAEDVFAVPQLLVMHEVNQRFHPQIDTVGTHEQGRQEKAEERAHVQSSDAAIRPYAVVIVAVHAVVADLLIRWK